MPVTEGPNQHNVLGVPAIRDQIAPSGQVLSTTREY